MGSASVWFSLAVVSVGMFLASGFSLPPFRWKILSYVSEKYAGIGESGQVQGVASNDATVFYLMSVGEGLVAVKTTDTPELFLNVAPHTGKLQASPNHDNSLKNCIFKLEPQPHHLRVQLLINASLDLPCPSSASEGSGAEVALSAGEQNGNDSCAIVKKCGIAFDVHGNPIPCQDQKDDSRDLGLIVQFL